MLQGIRCQSYSQKIFNIQCALDTDIKYAFVDLNARLQYDISQQILRNWWNCITNAGLKMLVFKYYLHYLKLQNGFSLFAHISLLKTSQPIGVYKGRDTNFGKNQTEDTKLTTCTTGTKSVRHAFSYIALVFLQDLKNR